MLHYAGSRRFSMAIAKAGFALANTTFDVWEFLDFRSKGLLVKSERNTVDAGKTKTSERLRNFTVV